MSFLVVTKGLKLNLEDFNLGFFQNSNLSTTDR